MSMAGRTLFERLISASVARQAKRTSHPVIGDLGEAFAGKLTRVESAVIEQVEEMRQRYQTDTTGIEIVDSGAGDLFGRRAPRRTIASIVKGSAIPLRWGRILFRIVRTLKPRQALELGTNLGISAGFILAALKVNGKEGMLVTIEGDPTMASKASEQVEHIARGMCRAIPGRFQDVLPPLLEEIKEIDFVFIDGHHEFEATMANFHLIRPHLSAGASVLFDDIATSSGVRKAWKHIAASVPGAIPLNLLRMGLLVTKG